MELLLEAQLPVSVLEGLHNELVQVLVSPAPDGPLSWEPQRLLVANPGWTLTVCLMICQSA